MSKATKTAHTLRAMARSCETVAHLLETPTSAPLRGNKERSIARTQFRVSVLEGYLPWLRKQYKGWNDATD